METPVVRSRGRPRKRRREENQSTYVINKSNVNEESSQFIQNSRKRGRPPKKKEGEIRKEVLVGRYVMKEFEGGVGFIGKIVSYGSGLYRVEYEDGDTEDFDSGELRNVLVGNESGVFVGDLLERKMKLDECVGKKLGVKLEGELVNGLSKLKGDGISGSEVDNNDDGDGDDGDDLCSESCEYGQGWEARLETEIPDVPPPELPPSSMNIGVPEEYVGNLFSVYGFLSSFSIRLFLSPFSLDDLVGCLNCTVPCTLLDSIHVALLRALRRHLESLASDGSENASKCLRCIDWGLLDMLTWPIYLVHYLITMGHLQGNKWNNFYTHVLEKDYHTLSIGMKLTVLQILCDDALDNADIREEINIREESEVGADSDGLPSPENEPKKVHLRNCKKSISIKKENVEEDTNVDECRICGMDGMLLCCDGCPSVYHSRCIGVSKLSIPEGEWFCPQCTFNKIGPPINSGTSLKGARIFGVDAYAQLFLGTCDHLLVFKVSVKPTSLIRYYNYKDIVKVINILCATPFHAAIYTSIREAIINHWGLPTTLSALQNRTEIAKNGNHEVLHSIEHENSKHFSTTCTYMGSIFKPNAYINHFIHGEYAFTAAAYFASLLSSDVNGGSNIHVLDPRKAMSANVSVQAKAFAMAAVRFFWPSIEKKLIEVPRERCSWCLNCKACVSSKKGCLLNQVAMNAMRAEMKFFSNCRFTKNVESCLYSVVIYMLYLEESLRGLMVGPFKGAAYREEWRKKVEEASTCSDLKSCLLELEGNISKIALSSEWTKMVDNWMDESSLSQSDCPIESTHKRGPGRRRKHLVPIKTTPHDSNVKPSGMTWWRGGKLAKLVLGKVILPSSVLKKSARQGGFRRMHGIYYADNGVPKRSRQLIWRADVEMSRNLSQLALQVRYFDHYIKWTDLVYPEQSLQDGKGLDYELFTFRSAQICKKKVVDDKIIYGLVFENPKYISARLMKSVIEKDTREDGKDMYWFSSTRLPLYLIKEYEVKAERTHVVPHKGVFGLSKLQLKQMRAFRRNVFHYLASKKDNLSLCLCTSCHKDVIIDFAATCSACKGYCHKECTLSSTVLTEEDLVFTTFCKQCSRSKKNSPNNVVESPTSPLGVQGKEYQNSAEASRSTKVQIKSGSNLAKIKKRFCHWGLIWKKKPHDDGSNFRIKNILFEGSRHDVNALNPKCYFCKKPYNPDYMYISCETCLRWYHADALELDKSRLPDLIGFKCTRCRRIKSPICPFADTDDNKTAVKRVRVKAPKDEAMSLSSASEAMSESVPSTPISAMEDDPLLIPISEVEHIPKEKRGVGLERNASLGTGPGPQKLQVKRHVKNEKDNEYLQPLFSPAKFDAGGDEFEQVNRSCENSCTGLLDRCEVEPVINDAQTNHLHCDMCSKIEPTPDLSCDNCGLKIHAYCSPWEEYSQGERWNCGRCRAWR